MAVALHVLAVLCSLVVAALWPLYDMLNKPSDPAARHRQRVRLGRMLVNPGLLLVLAFGIWAAADRHAFAKPYVAWGFVAVVLIGALEGSFVIRGHRRLAQAPAGGASDGAALARRTASAEWAITALVLITIVVMVAKP